MTHLTDEQIDELLMGSLDAAQAADLRSHAAACEACAAKLAQLEAPIASFKAVTLAWSERRSATLPVRPAATRSRWVMGLAWGSLAASALLAAVIPVLRHEQNVRVEQAYRNAIKTQGSQAASASAQQPANSANTQSESASTDVPENPQEIASDNQLLAMVDEELNAPIVAPGSANQARRHSRNNAPGSIQD